MAKLTHDDRLEQLERDNLDLKRRLNLVELYLDSEHRERSGWTLDDVRAAWGKQSRPPVPERGAV